MGFVSLFVVSNKGYFVWLEVSKLVEASYGYSIESVR